MTCTILLTKLRRANLQTSFSNELSRLLEDLLCFLKIINVSTDQIICLCLSDLLNDCSKAIDKQLDKSQTRNQTKRNSLILCDLYPRFHAITRDLTQLRLRQNQLRAEYHKACQTANPISPESTTSNLHHFEQSEGEEVDLDESDFESICPPEEDLDHFSCISNHSSSSEVSPSSKDPPYSARPTTPNYTPESPISPSPSSSLRLVLPDSYSCRGVTIVNHTITVVRKEVSLMDEGSVLVEGLLFFEGQFIPLLRPRYALLTTNTLFYFPLDMPISPSLVRAIPLEQATLVCSPSHSFFILYSPLGPHRRYRVQSEKSEGTMLWCEKIAHVIELMRKAISESQ
ncbi:hypothetical protein BLNAU_10729 [Blattamonas nauphoetae]|uniref:PH domain-containing protein n=1 Tax=Blattamonas nauphoetae TaxID=2049346 RepID=A0ABQ9XPP6_9EUKA|nr:hypothetical protein BLNAU_10729 [Blattamonas nauphoetae]